MRRMLALMIMLVVQALAGCSDTIFIRSYPPGAAVQMDGRPVGYTPIQYSIGRFQSWPKQVAIEKQGFEPFVAPFKTRSDILRVLATGALIPPFILSGFLFRPTSTSDYPHNYLDVTLEPVDEPELSKGDSLPADTRLGEIRRLYDKGNISREEYEAQRAKVLEGL